jgi:putative ATP-dependent endonuclease of the OLD family
MNVPIVIGDLLAFLQEDENKKDEVVQTLFADAISSKHRCSQRVRHLLSVLAAVATRRELPADAAYPHQHANGVTTMWTFNNALPGI